jgi:hypothetical protein
MKPICFVIAHRYYRQYPSYIEYYVENIQKFYEGSLTIIVDNNSKYLCDIAEKFVDNVGVVILTNDTECKFELGAYKCGIQYLFIEGLYDNYSFVVFSQDTFVLKNKFEFESLNGDLAGPLVGSSVGQNYDYGLNHHPMFHHFWNKLEMDKYPCVRSFCWCCSFFIHSSKMGEFFNLTRDIVITVRNDSCATERYFWMILYRLNNNRLANIDGLLEDIESKYHCGNVDVVNSVVNSYFVKRSQNKTETTLEM